MAKRMMVALREVFVIVEDIRIPIELEKSEIIRESKKKKIYILLVRSVGRRIP